MLVAYIHTEAPDAMQNIIPVMRAAADQHIILTARNTPVAESF